MHAMETCDGNKFVNYLEINSEVFSIADDTVFWNRKTCLGRKAKGEISTVV